MLMSKFGLMPLGGDAVGLSGIKLVIACIVSMVLGALLTVGIGNYAPTMCLVYMLGMSPAVSFPIMMGLGFLGVASGSSLIFSPADIISRLHLLSRLQAYQRVICCACSKVHVACVVAMAGNCCCNIYKHNDV